LQISRIFEHVSGALVSFMQQSKIIKLKCIII